MYNFIELKYLQILCRNYDERQAIYTKNCQYNSILVITKFNTKAIHI